MPSQPQYDVIVIGSGATGGIAAKELTEHGLETLVLEAGPALPEERFHQKGGGLATIGSWPRIKAALRGQHIQARGTFFSPEKSFLFVNDRENPYTWSRENFYLWIRGRNVGGRFLTWGRVAPRMSDYDFKAASRDGIGEDWPIDYQELAPYYERVERFLGIIGTNDGIPNLPDGHCKAQAGLSRLEQSFKQTVESRWPERHVVPWRYVEAAATPADEDTGTRTTAPLAAAKSTGRLTLRPGSIVERIDTDPATGRATGVTFVDANSKQRHRVEANLVLVCASTIESVRLLLNSNAAKHSDGLGNSSGVLGRYFMDQCNALCFGTVPQGKGFELVDGDSPANNHGGVYIPRYTNLDEPTHPEFHRGYNIQGIIGRPPVPADHDSVFGFSAQGEMPPYADNRITLNPRRKDAWGIPAAHVAISLTDNERHLVRAGLDDLKEMVLANGYSIDFAMSLLGIDKTGQFMPEASWLERLLFRASFRRSVAIGAAIHECGGARMGADPAKSVLNAVNQCWDAPNVFVTDSSCMPSNGTCGPTLTTMALTTRACEWIANEYNGSADIRRAD